MYQIMNHNTGHDTDAKAQSILRHLHSATNRRVLQGMSSFRPVEDTPDAMSDLLRRLDLAESRANGAR